MSDEDRMSQKNFFRWQVCIMGASVAGITVFSFDTKFRENSSSLTGKARLLSARKPLIPPCPLH
jgi:hypothetical protein